MKKVRSMKRFKRSFPRVGDDYQADIPPVMEKSDYLKLDLPASYSLGSSVLHGNGDKEPIQDADTSLSDPLIYHPSQMWTAIEREIFILGLYLFGKNLVLVSLLVGSKTMGDVSCFYYGKFFNSVSHIGWSYCLKSNSEYRVYGDNMVTGWRQEVLLNRLFTHLSQNLHDILIKCSEDFNNKTLSFDDYVFAMRDIVGIDVLVRAVGINRGKLRDLTLTPRDYRTSNTISMNYSSFAPSEIIEILTGNLELSESQSSDLFWRGVWPRLLAKGWRSEWFKDHRALGLPRPVVFIVKRVKTFSRELVKGTEYFNSVNEVLHYILGSEPGFLIEHEKRAPKAAQGKVTKTEPPKETEVGNFPSKTPGVGVSPLLNSVVTNGSSEEEHNKAVQVRSNDKNVNVTETTEKNGSPDEGKQTEAQNFRPEPPSSAEMNGSSEEECKAEVEPSPGSKLIVAESVDEKGSPDEGKEVISEPTPPPPNATFYIDLNAPYVPSDSEDDYVSAGLKIVIDLNIPYVGSDSDTDNVMDNGDEERQPTKKRAAGGIEHESPDSKKRKV